MRSKININGSMLEIDFAPHEYLLDVLRRYGYTSLRRGCNTSICSACTVLIDGKPMHACSIYMGRIEDEIITTVEGVKNEAREIAELLIREGVDQCGYCGPGFVMTLLGLENELENPTDDEILDYFAGNLCRCSGYVRQLTAIKGYLGVKE